MTPLMKVDRYQPPLGHPLVGYLQSIWRVRARGGYSSEMVLPKGNLDILFNLGDALQCAPPDGSRAIGIDQRVHVAGLQTTAFVARPAGSVVLVGVSLCAESAAMLLGLPAAELVNRTVAAELIGAGYCSLHERLHEAPCFDHCCRILLDWLLGCLASSQALSNEALGRALIRIPAATRVGKMARQLGFSERHLRRLFHDTVGIGPAHYARLKRFVGALELMHHPCTLTDVAHAAGYFDQAHFSKDFHAIAGMTPTEYRRRAGPVPGHLFTP